MTKLKPIPPVNEQVDWTQAEIVILQEDFKNTRDMINSFVDRIFETERLVAVSSAVIIAFLLSQTVVNISHIKILAGIVPLVITFFGLYRCAFLAGLIQEMVEYSNEFEKRVLQRTQLGWQRWHETVAKDRLQRFEIAAKLFWVVLLVINTLFFYFYSFIT